MKHLNTNIIKSNAQTQPAGRQSVGRQILLAALILLLGIQGIAFAERGELRWEEATRVTTIFDTPGQSLLVIHSTVDLTEIKSNRAEFGRDHPEPGVYHMFLAPGRQMITIRAEGFLPLQIPAFNYKDRGVREIKVIGFGAAEGYDADRPSLRLLYSPPSTETEVFVQLDDNPPQKMSFQGDAVTLRPTAGSHTVRVFAEGRVWEKTLDMRERQTYEETVNLSAGTRQTLAEVQPGNIYIESDPPGAAVFMNQVEQPGVTPMSINDLRPGTYEIQVVRDLYLPETRTVQVQELDYSDLSVELTPNFGRLMIDSEPSGALVYINDQQRGMTPLEIPRFNAGQYRMRLVKQLYYEEADTFRIEPGGQHVQTYSLRPQFGSLRVTSTPSGADVELDGARIGTTPLTKDQVFSGTHTVRVSLENYYPQERQVTVRDGERSSMDFPLSSSVGFLVVTSEPAGATVSVVETGRRLGTTPLRDVALDPGTYTLRLELEDYETYERTIPVSLAGTPPVSADLQRKTGHLQLETTPPRATIYLDGSRKGTTPTVLRDLPTGSYTLRLEKSGFDIQERRVTIEHNQHVAHILA